MMENLRTYANSLVLVGLISLVGLLALAGCAPEPFYASVYATGQNVQRNECGKLVDTQERSRCLKNTDTSYETYKRQTERLKP